MESRQADLDSGPLLAALTVKFAPSPVFVQDLEARIRDEYPRIVAKGTTLPRLRVNWSRLIPATTRGRVLAMVAGAVALSLAAALLAIFWPMEQPPVGSVSLAEAAERMANLEPQSYRMTRHSTWQGPLAMHEELLEREVVAPDRIRDLTRAYVTWIDPAQQRLFGSERQTISGCEGKADVSEAMVIGATEYNLRCDGSWAIAERDEPIRLGRGFYQLSGYWDHIKVLGGVTKVGSEKLGDVMTDVFQGEFTDVDGTLHEAKVWVARKDNLVRRLEEVWPGYTLELEVYDINDPTISIEPPE